MWLAHAGYIADTVWVIGAGMVLVRASTGVFFPYVIGNLQTIYHGSSNLWVLAIISVSFAAGGLIFSSVFYAFDPALETYFFSLLCLHLGLLPLAAGILQYGSQRLGVQGGLE
eukprot:UC1_evm1s917